MAPIVPSTVPTEIRAGDTVRFTQAPADYPTGEGWTLTYTLSGASKLAVAGVVAAGLYDFTLTAANTQGLVPGTYRWVLRAELSGAKYTVATGELAVLPSVADAAAGALVSADERELALLNAEIEARAGDDTTELTIGDRQLKREPLPELLAWRDGLRAKIARRRNGGRLAKMQTVFTGRGGFG